jgi:hypothetical protein
MAEACGCGGKSCPPEKKGPNKALKFALMGFVALSIGVAVYKMAAAPDKASVPPVEAAAAVPVAVQPAAKAPAFAGKKTADARLAVVYYFYTDTRCSSCKTIEEYTRAAVEKNFTAGYKGWAVVFKGVNVDEEPGKHFVQDYWLNSKSVVVQKFSGDKALQWGKLEKVWQLLDDKDAFINYITAETRKLLDEK